MATREELIVRLTHLLLTCRDDLTPEAEGRAVWNKIYDFLERHDLTISAVTIMQIPRTEAQCSAVMEKLDTSPIIPFGKFSGRSVADVAKQDKPYLRWMLKNVQLRTMKLKQAIEEAVR